MLKRAMIALAVLAAAAAWLCADGFEPNYFYKPAAIGFQLPEGADVSTDEDGNTYYAYGDSDFFVKIGQADKAMKNADILDEAKFKAVVKDVGAAVKQLWTSSTEGNLVFNSAVVTMTWDDGSTNQGFLVLANTKAAKNKTWIIGIFSPNKTYKLNDWDDPATTALESLTYVKK
jgi:hypothetical protein